MSVLNCELLFPDDVKGIITLEGSIDCAICDVPMTQKDIDNQELIAMTGKGEKPKAYCAHVKHFYKLNPATGDWDESPEYQHNLRVLARAYATGEGIDGSEERPVM